MAGLRGSEPDRFDGNVLRRVIGGDSVRQCRRALRIDSPTEMGHVNSLHPSVFVFGDLAGVLGVLA